MILQNLLFPDCRFCSDYEMYVRMADAPANGSCFDAQKNEITLDAGRSLSLDTLFNAFSIEKWLKYTRLDNLRLTLRLSGAFRVRIWRKQIMNEALLESLIEERICRAAEESAFSFVLPCIDAKGIYAAELVSLSDGAVFAGGAYETDAGDINDVRIAMDICTYRRETFVTRNIRLLNEAIINNTDSPLYGRLEIFVSDNARTLDAAALESECVHIFPNKNAGGSGGFARGMMEILKSGRPFTHALVMDDDVLISPEALERTARFLMLLKPEYSGKTVAGAMMRLDMRSLQHENGGVWNGWYTECVHTYMDMRRLENVLENEREQPADYNAWWYSCIPMTKISESNLPLPLFIRFDDVEFGLRGGSDIVMLNGVCLWHEPFEYKYASSMEYYHMRNGLIVDALRRRDVSGRAVEKHFIHMALSNLMRYRYDNVELLFRGAADFLEGPEFLLSTDPEALHKTLMAAGDKFRPLSEMDVAFDERKYLANYERVNTPFSRALRGEDGGAPLVRSWTAGDVLGHIWRRITLNGLLLPAKGDNVVNAVANVTSDYFRKRAVLNYNPADNRGFVSRRDAKRSFKLLFEIFRRGRALGAGYEKAAAAYRAHEGELTGLPFWTRYLGLGRDEK